MSSAEQPPDLKGDTSSNAAESIPDIDPNMLATLELTAAVRELKSAIRPEVREDKNPTWEEASLKPVPNYVSPPIKATPKSFTPTPYPKRKMPVPIANEELATSIHSEIELLKESEVSPIVVSEKKAIFGGLRKALIKRKQRKLESEERQLERDADFAEYLSDAVLYNEPYMKIYNKISDRDNDISTSSNPNPRFERRPRPQTREDMKLAKKLEKIKKKRAHAISTDTKMHRSGISNHIRTAEEKISNDTKSLVDEFGFEEGYERADRKNMMIRHEISSLSKKEKKAVRKGTKHIHKNGHHLEELDMEHTDLVLEPRRRLVEVSKEKEKLRLEHIQIERAQARKRNAKAAKKALRAKYRSSQRGSIIPPVR